MKKRIVFLISAWFISLYSAEGMQKDDLEKKWATIKSTACLAELTPQDIFFQVFLFHRNTYNYCVYEEMASELFNAWSPDEKKRQTYFEQYLDLIRMDSPSSCDSKIVDEAKKLSAFLMELCKGKWLPHSRNLLTKLLEESGVPFSEKEFDQKRMELLEGAFDWEEKKRAARNEWLS